MDIFRRNLIMKKLSTLICLLLIATLGFTQADKKIFGELTVTDTIETNKGYKFPDSSFQITAASGTAVNVADSLKAGVTDSLLINTNALIVRTTGQVGIGIGSPDASSLLDITSVTKGLLYPRMTTTQRDAIGSPATGLSIYNLTNDDPNFFNGTAWRRITHAPGASLKIGAVIFATGVSALDGDSVNFFWDNTNNRLGIGVSDPDEKLEVAGRIHLGQTTVPSVTTDKLYNESGALFWNGIDLTSPGTTIEFTSTFDNTLITKLSGAGTIVYDVSNPSTGQIAINGGTVTKVGKLLAYQFHVISDQDAEFVLIMDISLIPGEIVSMSVVADDGSLHQLGFRSPGARQIRFNRDDAINADLDHHILVWVDGGSETAVIPVGTFTGTAGSIPFSNGTSIVEDNANLFYDDVNNRLGIGTSLPTEKLEVSGNIKGDTAKFSNYSGGHVIPLTDSTYDLGSVTKRWRDLYVTGGTIYLGSETLSIDSNGALSFSGAGGISTPSSSSGWLDIQRKSATNDQTGIDQGIDIILDSANGNIPYNATTGIATLKATGNPYVLWGTFAAFSISSGETIAIQWVRASDNTPLYEGHETRLRPQSSSSNGNNQPTIKLIYKPTVDTDVKLRCTEYTGTPDTFSLYWDRSMATISELR